MFKLENENARSFIILLAEDNPDDVLITKKAFEKSKFLHRMYITTDGEETIAFLNRAGKFRDVPTPDLILLDLNLPKKNGHEVLTKIKNDPNLEHIPVIVLTISDAEKDILNSYSSYANCYITKPIEFEKFLENVKMIEDFWLSIVKLPRSRVNG